MGPIAQVLLSFLPTHQPPASCLPLFLSPCPLRVTVLPEACKHRGRWLLQPLPLLPAAHGLGRAAEPPVLPRAVPLPTLLSPRRLPLHHHPHLSTHGVWVCILTLTLKAGGSPRPLKWSKIGWHGFLRRKGGVRDHHSPKRHQRERVTSVPGEGDWNTCSFHEAVQDGLIAGFPWRGHWEFFPLVCSMHQKGRTPSTP